MELVINDIPETRAQLASPNSSHGSESPGYVPATNPEPMELTSGTGLLAHSRHALSSNAGPSTNASQAQLTSPNGARGSESPGHVPPTNPEPMELTSGTGLLAHSRYAPSDNAGPTANASRPPPAIAKAKAKAKANTTAPSPPVHEALLAARSLSAALEKLSQGRPNAASLARHTYKELQAAIHPLIGNLTPENTTKATDADALRRIVREEVRAEITAAKEKIASASAHAAVSSVAHKAITSASKEAAVAAAKEATAASAKEAAKEARKTWASVAAAATAGATPAPPSRPGGAAAHGSGGAPRIVPKRVARQINIRAKDLPPEYASRSPRDTVDAINRHGRGGALAVNKLPSGDLAITFDEATHGWHTTNTEWAAKAFGTAKVLALRTYAVLAKGVHKSLLNADMERVANTLSAVNKVRVFRARPKYFSRTAATAALLLEFTNIHDANTVCDKGIIWDAGFYPCEVYDGDLRPIIYYQCWAYGHKARFCRRPALCPNCAGRKHEAGRECPAAAGKRDRCCPSCKGRHGALDKECPEYKKQWAAARRMLSERPTHFAVGGRSGPSPTPAPAAQGTPPPPAPVERRPRGGSPQPEPTPAQGAPAPDRRPTKRRRGHDVGRPSGLAVAAGAPGQCTLASSGLLLMPPSPTPQPGGTQAPTPPPASTLLPPPQPALPPIPSLPPAATFELEETQYLTDTSEL